MWKFLTRGIRETLERRANCRTNVYSQTSKENGGTKNQVRTNNFPKEQKLLANVASSNNEFCDSTKTGGPKDKKYDSKWDPRRSWSDAVGWSSVLAVGWVVCQTLCLRRRLFERSKDDKWHNRLLKFHGIPLSFVDTFDLQSLHILPVTNCVANSSADDEDRLNQEWTTTRPYGPITIEEALKEAKNDYTRTHRHVMGEFELRFGVKALDEKRYKDAIKHFSTGANLSSSGSMFNLGLCHELGIGTTMDTTKAAKYYRNAAEKGHPDAMYNLGVFHAQGRGGLNLDIEKARELFVEAANLGQSQAQIALDLEKNVQTFANKDSPSESLQTNFRVREKHYEKSSTKTLLQMVGNDNSSPFDEIRQESFENITYYDNSNNESANNSTDIFLNSLGIHTNPQPIFVGTSDSNVPYYN